MLIEDTDMVPSFMDGKEYKAAKFAHTLRTHLFKEHLGLLEFTKWEEIIHGKAEQIRPGLNQGTSQPQIHRHSTEQEIQNFEKAGPDMVLNHEKRSGSVENELLEEKMARALDPLADHCCKELWNKTAHKNTMIYRDLFRCVPDDTVHTFEQHRKFLPDPTKIPHGHVANPDIHGREIRNRLSKVTGHLVEFPSNYLKDENMLGSLIRETVTPMVIFT